VTVLGAPIHLTASFTDATNSPVDPSTVTLWLNLPDGTTTSFPAVKDAVGKYHYDYTPTLVGTYDFWFAGTGSNAAIQAVDIFTVTPASSGALVSLADAKAHLNKAATSPNPATSDDAELVGFIHSASAVVNWLCGYSRPTSFTEFTTPRWNALVTPMNVYASVVTQRLPLLTVTSIVPQFYGGPLPLTGLVTDPDAGIIYIPLSSLAVGYIGPVALTYQAGRQSVPTVLREAALIILQNLWETQRGPAGGSGPRMGGLDDMVQVPGMGSYIPSKAMQLMRESPYFAAAGVA
jgi:hypothetical protein